MKKIIPFLAFASLFTLASCDLDIFPETNYNESNAEMNDEQNPYNTTEDIKKLVDGLYSSNIKGIQEAGFLDWLVYSECRADNAYNGNPGTGEIVAIEANSQDGENKNVVRDWDYFQQQVSNANQILCNIDRIRENDLENPMTDTQYKEWKSQACIWRAYNLFTMSQLWGDIPCVTVVPPPITAANIEEVYSQYYPARMPIADVYAQIIEDLTYAAENGPEPNVAAGQDKYLLSKAFAHGMLARVYAEPTANDWAKVAQHCQAVENYGFKLCDDYGEMWSYDDNDVVRNTQESIFEITWTKSSGHWVWMMFHRNAYNLMDSYSWTKWITPSRDLIAAYDAAGDTERKNASIIFDECTWSNYYPQKEYAFMHKAPTNASSIILMRLGEIYLLHAEALAKTGDLAKATEYVNKIRTRAGINTISQPSSQDAMIDAILDERRLELAFEGFRFFDLLRHGFERAKAIHDDINIRTKDNYWQTRLPLTPETVLMPIPQGALDNNPSLEQNAGY